MKPILKQNNYLIIFAALLLFTSLACADLAELPTEPGGLEQPGDASGGSSQEALPTLAPLPENDDVEVATEDMDESTDDLVGISVVVNDVYWTLLETAELGEGLESDSESVADLVADGRLVGLRFAIENQSDETLTYTGLAIVDDQDERYSYLSAALPFIVDEEACEVEELAPGTTLFCTAIFDVPANATGLQGVFTDLSLFGGSQELVDLELE